MSTFNKRSGHRLLTTSDLSYVHKEVVKAVTQVSYDLTDIDIQQISSIGNHYIILTKLNTLIIITTQSLPQNIILPNPEDHIGYTVHVKYSAPFSVNGITVNTVPGSVINVFNPNTIILPKSTDTPMRFKSVEASAGVISWEVI